MKYVAIIDSGDKDLSKERLENCPLVEIVTCQECKHYYPDEDGQGESK